ncbi:MAG: TetR/AcrR family transcriptional regulator, partial [Bacilli bacterium]
MPSRPGLDRASIVEAAGKLADEAGLDRLTLSGLAVRLGVRTPALYNHIVGLDGLRREHALSGIQELNRHLQRAAIGKESDKALEFMLHAYRAFVHERPGVYEAILRAPNPDSMRMQEASNAILDTVLTVLEPYGLTREDSIHTVRAFRAIGHGFVSL